MKGTADLKLDTQILSVSAQGAIGYIYNSLGGYIPDGSRYQTAPVKNLDTWKTDGFIETKNTIYRIVE